MSNTTLKIVKILATFKENAEAQLSDLKFKHQDSTLKLTALSAQNS